MRFTIALVVYLVSLPVLRVAVANELHPEGAFLNSAGVTVAPESLRFTESGWKKGRDQGFALALQRGTDYFYLWANTPGAGGMSARPLCDGHLVEAGGGRVNVDDLRSFAIADLEGNGSTYLIALIKDGAGLLAWKLDKCEGRAIFPSLAATQHIASGDSHSGFQYLLTGDFADAGVDAVELISADSTQISQWRFAGNKFELVRSDPLLVDPVSNRPVKKIHYVTATTRMSRGSENAAHETATLILHDRGYTLYRNGTPIYYAPVCNESPTNCSNRILLVNLDQGFSNGLQDLARKDSDSAKLVLNRMISTLHSLQGPFTVWALIDPIQQDRAAMLMVLDTLTKAGIPFLLDYYSSDVTNLAAVKKGWLDYSPQALDPIKGVSLSLEGSATEPDNLDFFAQRYGSNFMGVRIMERLGMDIQANDSSFDQLVSDHALAKRELSIDWDLVRQLLIWSNKNRRYVVWADPALYIPYECYWTADQVARARARRDLYVTRQRSLARQYPYVLPMYDNNEGLKRCGVVNSKFQMTPRNFRLTNWEATPKAIAQAKTGSELLTGQHGFGISVQSWTSDFDPLLSAGTLPPEEMAIWILDALQKGAGIVELEPYFYLFAWPKDAILKQSRPIAAGRNVGEARDELIEIMRDVVGN